MYLEHNHTRKFPFSFLKHLAYYSYVNWIVGFYLIKNRVDSSEKWFLHNSAVDLDDPFPNHHPKWWQPHPYQWYPPSMLEWHSYRDRFLYSAKTGKKRFNAIGTNRIHTAEAVSYKYWILETVSKEEIS